MKRPALSLLCAAATAAAQNVTNTVMMVDQRGNLNTEAVASVEAVAANAAKAEVAEAKAEAARLTAEGVTTVLGAVVSNIMSNNVVVYRSGFSDSLAPLVFFTAGDRLVITDARWTSRTAEAVTVELDYVCTADVGALKPDVYALDTLARGGTRDDFAQLPSADVSSPSYHSGAVEAGGQTYAGYYTVSATVRNPADHGRHFVWVRVEADAPSGDGAALDLPNGVTGGATTNLLWGGNALAFRGGVLVGVSPVED